MDIKFFKFVTGFGICLPRSPLFDNVFVFRLQLLILHWIYQHIVHTQLRMRLYLSILHLLRFHNIWKVWDVVYPRQVTELHFHKTTLKGVSIINRHRWIFTPWQECSCLVVCWSVNTALVYFRTDRSCLHVAFLDESSPFLVSEFWGVEDQKDERIFRNSPL